MPKFLHASCKGMSSSRKFDFQTSVSSPKQKTLSIGKEKESPYNIIYQKHLQKHKMYESLKEILIAIRRCKVRKISASENRKTTKNQFIKKCNQKFDGDQIDFENAFQGGSFVRESNGQEERLETQKCEDVPKIKENLLLQLRQLQCLVFLEYLKHLPGTTQAQISSIDMKPLLITKCDHDLDPQKSVMPISR